MNQKAKLDQLILRILKEEMDAMNTDSVKEEGNPDAKFFIYDNYAKKTIGKGFKTKEEAKKALDAVMEARPDLAHKLSISDGGEMDEEQKTLITPDGTPNTATSTQKQDSMHTKAGDTVKYKKPGQLEENDESVQDMDHDDAQPQGLDLAASLEEVMAHLKGIQEAPKDAKHANHAGKVMKHISAAQEALKGLKGHNDMLEAKEVEQDQKDAGKHLVNIKKHLFKVIKDKDTLERIMKKMPIEKAIELKKAKGGELDEEKVAKAILKHVIKEGTFNVKKKSSQQLEEGQYGDAETSGKIEVEKNGQKIEGDAKLTYYTEDADAKHRIPTILITNNGKNVASIMFDKQKGKFIEGHTSGGATYEPVNDLAKKMFDELKNKVGIN